MRIPKIKVNKVSTDNIFKPLSLVTLYLLERCEDEALQEALRASPGSPAWHDVRQIIKTAAMHIKTAGTFLSFSLLFPCFV